MLNIKLLNINGRSIAAAVGHGMPCPYRIAPEWPERKGALKQFERLERLERLEQIGCPFTVSASSPTLR
jgi:hypothetical protein